MSHHNGYSEDWSGGGGPNVNRGSDYPEPCFRKPQHFIPLHISARRIVIACIAGAVVGFWGGVAWSEPVLTALYSDMTPTTGGPTVRLYGGVLSTPEICGFAGNGIKDGIEAEVADVAVTITCKPLPDGVAA